MNRSIKKVVAFALAIVMLFGAIPVLPLHEISAKATGDSGICGENLAWSFDEASGVLAIKGSGEMTDYSPTQKAPWYDFRNSIKTVTLSNGFINIGDYAFEDCSFLSSVTIDRSEAIYNFVKENNYENCEMFDGMFIQPYISSANPDDIAETYFKTYTNNKAYRQKTRDIIIDVIKDTSDSESAPEIYVNVTYHYEFIYFIQETNEAGIGTGTYRPDVYEKDIVYPIIPTGATLNADSSPLICCIKYYPQYGTVAKPAKDIITINNLEDIPIKLLVVKQWPMVYIAEGDKYEEMGEIALYNLETNYLCEIKENHSPTYDLEDKDQKMTYTNARINLATYGNTNEEISGVSFKVYSDFHERTRTGLIRDGALFCPMSIGDSAFKGCTKLDEVIYVGTKEEWNAAKIEGNNECLFNAIVHYCKKGDHSSNFNAFSYFQEAHPHYAVYKCECGAEWISAETAEIETCEICNPPHSCCFDTIYFYTAEHPHYAVYKCECGAEQVSEETTKLDSCRICNPSIPREDAEIKRPSTSSIDYGDSIVLHFDADVELPAGAKIVWSADNGNFSYSASADGKTCTITPKSSGETVFTAKVVDASGKTISEEYTQKMTSNAGFFQKLVAFFKKLFGSTKIIAQAYNFDF